MVLRGKCRAHDRKEPCATDVTDGGCTPFLNVNTKQPFQLAEAPNLVAVANASGIRHWSSTVTTV